MNSALWFDAYREEMFWYFPVAGSLVSMGSFLLWAVPLTWMALREPAWAAPWRIQAHRPKAERLIWPGVRSWLSNNLILFALVVALWPAFSATRLHGGPLPSVWEVAWQLAFFVLLDDFLYYWMHRLMHHPRLFRHVHAVHHRVPTPWAISAHYMHPIEFTATGLLMLLGPVLVGAHLLTLYLWIAMRQWEAAEGHCGYELPWSPSRLLGHSGATYHDFHHSKTWGNYAGFLGYLDRYFGNYAKGYLERRSGGSTDARSQPR